MVPEWNGNNCLVCIYFTVLYGKRTIHRYFIYLDEIIRIISSQPKSCFTWYHNRSSSKTVKCLKNVPYVLVCAVPFVAISHSLMFLFKWLSCIAVGRQPSSWSEDNQTCWTDIHAQWWPHPKMAHSWPWETITRNHQVLLFTFIIKLRHVDETQSDFSNLNSNQRT